MSAFDEEVDVVVVGSGGGVAGAYTAAREGLSVALVEATDRFGGTTAYSGGGGMWFPCHPVGRRAGLDDTPEDALAYFHRVVGDRTPYDLQRTYVLGGARLVEYLEEDDCFRFAELPWPDYYGAVEHARADGRRHIVPVPLPAADLGPVAAQIRGPLDTERLGHPAPDLLTGGRALIGRFLAALARFPHARAYLGAPLVDLIDVDRAVVGAVVNRDGRDVRIRARRGVLLAAGGFEQNPEMRQKWGVPGRSEDSMGCPGNTGIPHRAAIRLGADTDLMDQAWWSPGLVHPDGRSAFALWFTGGIFVNQRGERFVNESAPYDRLGRAVLSEIDSGAMTLPFWMIYDDREGTVPPVKATNVSMVDTARYEDAGLWHTAETLDALAHLIGVPSEALAATVTRYNAMVADGHDTDFGRGDEPYDRAFSAGKLPMVPIDRPPFHAAAFGVSDLGTKGGLRTDTSARVLDTAGRPIAGLYAAGNTMAAVSGTTYPGGGNPIGASLLFSHLAALDMAGAGPR
ncbi:FAD-binding protein [Mycolicibacterium litorale]|uniref:3-ketosteroid-delta-1-dehydrogenase n=1 Tax=Mycolicibacterium litorale TaxID=758802 RepID=A0AAD1IMX3_9MYCO|nr:FAD-binding protein [Mycolicibacterium litorale]MCV7417074.1 FAD-binding protein [Mycolicibacterium litorale]TDY04861.1 3-oxosteroid 1-dehydrogenase [Mycolicibacterium litorale]BBY18290.1 3-ketosteroid-delta-1-dehydrogenase [Mycolicibacterium litorale]